MVLAECFRAAGVGLLMLRKPKRVAHSRISHHLWAVRSTVAVVSLLCIASLASRGEFELGSGEVPFDESNWLWCESEEEDGKTEVDVPWVAPVDDLRLE